MGKSTIMGASMLGRIFGLLLISLLVPILSFAADFTATTIGDFGNVTVMEVTGNYDANNADGTLNVGPRQVIAKEFFRKHKDEYDFIIIFSNFDYAMIEAEALAFYTGVKNDTQGIGQPLFDNTQFYGSKGKLQGTIDMGNLSKITTDPLDPKFEKTLSVLAHEQLHRWAAYIKYRGPDGNDNTALLGRDAAHWSFLLDSGASVLYGNKWQDNGNGTFTSVQGMKYLSPLDLYLMGFNDKLQVPPMLLIDNPSVDPLQLPKVGETVPGTAKYISIDDIIAAEGPRVPSAQDSQKIFKAAFIFVTRPGTYTGNELYSIETLREGWMTRFSVLTDGQGLLEVTPTVIDDIPGNPGVTPVPGTPRTIPADLNDGLKWLMDKQQIAGNWIDLQQTTERDTAESISALMNFPSAQQNYQNGLQWIAQFSSENTDFLSRKILALKSSDGDVGSLLSDLLSRQNADGGWGSNTDYMSNTVDTAVALKALSMSGPANQAGIDRAINYIKSKQNTDGGWGTTGGSSSIEVTANVLSAFNKYRQSYPLDDAIAKGVALLVQKQNSDGGFGNSPSTVYDTAVSVLVLKEVNASKDVTRSGFNYIRSQQDVNGSWNSSAYQTALAISAMWAMMVDPDLSVRQSDIALDPAAITSVPTNVTINATIWNYGLTSVQQVKVALYDGAVISANKIAEQTVAVQGQASALVSFTVAITDGRERTYFVAIDPEGVVAEPDRSNNTASIVIAPPSGVEPDLSIMSSEITFTPPAVTNIPAQIAVNAIVHNYGLTPVPQAKIALFSGTVSGGARIAEQTVSVDGRSSTIVSFPVTVSDGNDHVFSVVADPDNETAESIENNNTGVGILRPATTYDFEVLSSGIVATPNPVDSNNDINITAQISNKGMMDAYNVQVKYFVNDNGTIIDIATSTVNVKANSTITDSITWKANHAGANMDLVVLADPYNSFQEISKDNNKASVPLTVKSATDPNLSISYQDIVITPSPAMQAGNAAISASVKNSGASAATNVKVSFYKGVPGAGGVLIDSKIVPSIDAGSSAQVSSTWANIQDSGERIIFVQVDPDSSIKETTKDDNSAFVVLNILSLPDLAISADSITFSPPAPKDGDTVVMNILVQNKGQQAVSNVIVRASEGSAIIGSGIISSIPGNSQASTAINYDTLDRKGPHVITVVVDPDNQILEQSKDNNTATRTFGVQDANLWVTQPYFSPNGDGVKDNTQFFFRLAAPQTVKIAIINSKGQSVRTFSGGELENTGGGNIIWDGLNDDGSVVPDGQYQITILDTNGANSGGLLVTVDNNRSSLIEAIGTKYLLNNNLTCMLPDIGNQYSNYRRSNSGIWKWFTDESGVVFDIASLNSDTPEYNPGLYSMPPDGEDITHLSPLEWTKGMDPTYDYFIGGYSCDSDCYSVSPDGQKVLFTLEKYNRKRGVSELSQLWAVNRDGRNPTLLASKDLTVKWTPIEFGKWSPGNDYVVYEVAPFGQSLTELWIVKSDGTGQTRIDSGYNGTQSKNNLKWSPDGTKIANIIYRPDWKTVLRVVDIAGNKTDLQNPAGDYYSGFEWLDDSRTLAAGSYGSLWIIDAAGSGNNMQLSGNSTGDYWISTDKKSIAFIETTGDKSVLKIADKSGSANVLYESSKPGYCQSLTDIVWSKDSSKLAFVDLTYEKTECTRCYDGFAYNGYAVVADLKSKEQKSFKVGNDAYSCGGGDTFAVSRQQEMNPEAAYSSGSLQWLTDNLDLIAQDSNGIFAINAESGKQLYLPIEGYLDRVSPLGRYVNYYQDVPLSSICYGRGYQDIWAMSSLLNLTADLKVTKNKSSITLKGIASDLNFEGYKIEYADAKNPTVWNLVNPPSDVPVFNDVFTTWVPPYEGVFYAQLTVWDKAGNTAVDRKRVSWGLASSVTNLYKTADIFSPNGDGVKDTAGLNYTVLEPVHLEFNIYDENNTLVRTFLRDYTAPADDSIIWDGRDESGRVVPDGKYSITLFDYQFFVELDNKPPDIAGVLGKLAQSEMPPGNFYTEFDGHVYDKNLKSWTIEYGQGDNPQEWHEVAEGSDVLVGRDADGNLLLHPIQDIEMLQATDSEMTWLVGSRLRVTAEDYAGNKSTSTSDVLEEQLLLYHWADQVLLLSRDQGDKFRMSLPLDAYLFAKSGPVQLGGLSTLRTQIAKLNVQYSEDGQWRDSAQLLNAEPGMYSINWDSPGMRQGNLVRIKAVDINGKEYHSNVVGAKERFEIDCTGSAINSLFDEIKVLSFEVLSSDDPQYERATVYKSFDSGKGDAIPVGIFSSPGPRIINDKKYQVHMIGTGASGKQYDSGWVAYPFGCGEIPPPLGFELETGYDEAACNSLSDGIVTLTAKIYGTDGMALKTLSYYIQKNAELQLVRQFDLVTQGWDSATVDTRNMPEGRYPVSAVLAYLDLKDFKAKELHAGNVAIVDRILPDSKITYPGKNAALCPLPADSRSSWFYMPVEGIAADNTGVQRFELFYGAGDTPVGWASAMTRVGGKKIPIVSNGPAKGTLGRWDIGGLNENQYSLKLKVVDQAGNVSCDVTNFIIYKAAEISLTGDKKLFSPNADGNFDELNISYELDKNAMVDIKVFKLLEQAEGSDVPDITPLRTIVSGYSYLGGIETTAWDGNGDSGAVLPDGKYAVVVFAKDSCGNVNSRWIPVEIDNTPPATVITYPRPPDPLGTIVEIKGTTSDLHFNHYVLEAGAGDNPDTWTAVSSGISEVKDNVLGKWNNFGLDGKWTLRLTAIDTVGNQNTASVLVDLGQRKTLIKDLGATPSPFSPNNDGKLDASNIKYELTDACQVEIDILDASAAVRKKYTTTSPSAGVYYFIWDGKDDNNVAVPDSPYTVKLTAALSTNTSVTQTESVTGVVDVIPPAVDIRQPAANSYLSALDIPVSGSISDANLSSYTIQYAGPNGAGQVDAGNQNRQGYTFGILSGLPEGTYSLNVSANDLAGNDTTANVLFTIDRTAPAVALDTPKEGEYYGSSKNSILIAGSIVEKNLELFSLRYSPVDNPAQWTELLGGNAISALPQLFTWKAGKNDGIPDGLYIVSLYAKDRTGLTGEAKVKVTIDNTLPEVAIVLPKDNDYVTKALEIKGTAADLTLDNYTVELSGGTCASAFKWSSIKSSLTPVKDGVLATLAVMPPDGDYCIRLTAADKPGNKSEAKVSIKIDTHPPAAPVLTGNVENRSNSRLNWSRNTEPDLAGYNVYRDGRKVNTALLTETGYLDQNLTEGQYTYVLTALDFAGNESLPSNAVKLDIDLTGPDVRISSPQNGSRVSSLLNIKGTAFSTADFKQYRVYYGQGASPTLWRLIRTSPVPVSYGVLTQWDTITLAEGQYSIKLEAEDLTGNISTDQVTVTVDNTQPDAPVLISAVPNSSDVALTWKSNTESDLLGYLLYRNDQLANVPGIVIGDLKPYAITGTAYADKALPDGKYKYYLVALDQAGNISNQSNTLEITIDTHAPRAVIVTPSDKMKLQDKVMVKAESPDLDVAAVQFQYKKPSDTVWINVGNPVTLTPFITYFDPKVLQLTYGDYQLRAVATDQNGKTDQAAPYITLTYSDLTAPGAPAGLKAATIGNDVTLTWSANTESDLAGYNVYRTSGGTKTKLTSSIITAATYQDKGLADGEYSYEITAIDNNSNESNPSNSAPAKIYAPQITQPYTPVSQHIIELSGGSPVPGVTVELDDLVNSVQSTLGTIPADAQGKFKFQQAALSLGENRLSVKATDGLGNISRSSDAVIVVYDTAPAKPAGLTSSVTGHNVALAWNPNIETNLSGYNLFKKGVKVNSASAVAVGTVTSSSSYYDNPPSYAFDSDQSTYWMSNYADGTFNPVWLEIDLSSKELINHIDIHWHSETDAQSNETIYAGKDYEIQVWSGYAWIKQSSVTGNASKDNSFDFSPSYRTDKIRIYMTSTTDINYSQQVGITEIKVLKDNLITDTNYNDNNVQDGSYPYTITAVDYYGFESAPSDEAGTIVGDITPPAAPQNLTAAAAGPIITLNWTSNTESDLAGYNIYRNSAQGWLKVNTSIVIDNTYADTGLVNATYTYHITAVDTAGNESVPSNDASAEVGINPPQSPISLSVTSVTVGGALNVSWDYAGTAAGYNLYRSTTKGGPYSKLNAALLTGKSYADNGLTNGTTYYYVSTALDLLGNESPYSNEGNGTPSDSIQPAKPVLFYPTISTVPIVLYHDVSNIAGMAEPGSSVEIFRYGILAGKADALPAATVTSMTTDDNIYSASLSPDSSMFVYAKSDGLWLKNLKSGEVVELSQNGDAAAWSADSSKLAFTQYDSNGAAVRIYDAASRSMTSLTGDSNVNELGPSWSADGTKIAFVSNRNGGSAVWIKDLTLNTYTQITSGSWPSVPRISPDGLKVAYFEWNNLIIADLVSGDVINVDSQADGYTVDWSSDSGNILFISSRTGSAKAFIYNLSEQSPVPVTDTAQNEIMAAFSPDGSKLVLSKYDGNGKQSIWIAAADSQAQAALLKQDVAAGIYLDWIASGGIALVDGKNFSITYPAGYFAISNIRLAVGENIFSAAATDASGNVGPSSDEIYIAYDQELLPDLEATGDGISISPASPVEGETATVNAVIRNKGDVDTSNVDVAIYLWDSKGSMTMLASKRIPVLAAHSETSFGATVDTRGKTGMNQIIVNVDSLDTIMESDETNNVAIKDFVVTAQEGVVMNARLDAGFFSGNQDTTVHIDLTNSGSDRSGTLETWIGDKNGQKVASADTRSLQLPYGFHQTFGILWNTGTTYAGDYRAYATLKDSSAATIAETMVPFSILPDMNVDVALTTDKAVYGSNENVDSGINIASLSNNYIIDTVTAKVVIADAAGNVLFSDVKTVSNLLPGGKVSLSSSWNTVFNPAGDYHASVDILIGDKLVMTKTSAFKIVPSFVLSGSLKVTPPVVILGGKAQIDFSIHNSGNNALTGLPLTVLVVDPDSQATSTIYSAAADLGTQGTATGTAALSTTGYSLKTYSLVLQYAYQGNTRTIASANFSVRDGTPPVVSIVTPTSGSIWNGKIDLAAKASDDSSGVDKVEYRIDNGDWKLLPISDPSTGRYGSSWSPTSSDQGLRSISFRATDKAGNVSDPVSVNVIVDLTPPNSAISSPLNGTTLMGTAFSITGTASDQGGQVRTVEISTDGGATWSQAQGITSWSFNWTVSAEGSYTIKSRATDSAGNVEIPGAGATVYIYKRQPSSVSIGTGQLQVNGNPFTIKGVVYSPVPIGDDPETMGPYGDYITINYNAIYNRDLPILRQMGANTVRLMLWDGTADHHDFLDSAYNGGAQPIYVIAQYWMNPGLDIDPQSSNNVRQQLKSDFRAMVAANKNHPAILMWTIGNNLNDASYYYGGNLNNFFSLINEMAAEAHSEEGNSYHPVTVALTDSNLISTISAYGAMLPSLDAWGANVYRGNTFGTLFNDFRSASAKPLVILEYGIDAFDNVNGDEYENIGIAYQDTYAAALWQEIKANSDVCMGGAVMEYSDEWWKGKYSTDPGCPDSNPALHSNCGRTASNSPDQYDNEEWWGIMRTRQNGSGPDTMETRAVFYTLQELWVQSSNAPHISVSPSPVAFGSVALGSAALSQTITISNKGQENLDIKSVTLSGNSASEFALLNDHCSSRTLIPSGTCTFKLSFAPASSGSKDAVISIASNDPDIPAFNLALSGTATVSVSGTVTSAQGPVAGVTMTLSGTASATATTDSSGNYIFTGLNNGNYMVTPTKAGYSFSPASNSLNVNGGNMTGVNFSAVTSYSISGTITSSEGPMPGVTVTLSGAASATSTTDTSGNFNFPGLNNGSYIVTPAKTGYLFTPSSNQVTVNGSNITGQNFTGVPAAYTITPSAGIGGSISPSSPQTVNYNGTAAFSITPDAGYRIADVAVDGVSKGAISSYSFTNVVSNHAISATFALNTLSIIASAGADGSITPSGTISVNYGGSQTFNIVPAAGEHITDVIVDGVSQGAISSYTFTNVTANHTISASFTTNFAIFGATGITMSGVGIVDSYDSSKGPYSGAHGSNTSIGTNSASSGAITLSGTVSVFGDAWVGPGGNPAKSIVMSGNPVITGKKGTLSAAKDMTAKVDTGAGTQVTIKNGMTLTSGSYRSSSVTLSGSNSVTINGNVTLYVSGSMTLSGNSQIIILPGSSLTLYIGGSVNVSGLGIINKGGIPRNLVIYGTSTCTSVNYSGRSDLYGAIHAPKASVVLSGTSNIFGSLIGRSIVMSGTTAVHYDENLGNIGN